nr:hypothetical protein [Novacetimonas hansenii]
MIDVGKGYAITLLSRERLESLAEGED